MKAIRKILRGYKPLAYAGSQIVLARGFDLYLASLDLEQRTFLARIPQGGLRRACARVRLIARATRAELSLALYLPAEHALLVAASGRIFLVALGSGEVVEDFRIPRGRAPLYLQHIDVDGFTPGVYFGEYIANDAKGPLAVYRRTACGQWEEAFRFPAGVINHIHNIVPDPLRRRVFILTGDFGGAAAIWVATDNFASVERWLGVGQQSRACWLTVDPEGVLFASDTQFETNHLYRVEDGPGAVQARARRLFPLAGSSIYCIERGDGQVVFSTAVEPNNKEGILAMLDRRPHDGMLGNVACIYSGSARTGFTVLARGSKDEWPLRLFQFGSFTFPTGLSLEPALIHAYGIALRKYDGCTLLLEAEAQ